MSLHSNGAGCPTGASTYLMTRVQKMDCTELPVGALGLVDYDVVDESNLQRQILHWTSSAGVPKISVGFAEGINERGDFLVPTIPAVDETAIRFRTELAFPHFDEVGGYEAVRLDGHHSQWSHSFVGPVRHSGRSKASHGILKGVSSGRS